MKCVPRMWIQGVNSALARDTLTWTRMICGLQGTHMYMANINPDVHTDQSFIRITGKEEIFCSERQTVKISIQPNKWNSTTFKLRVEELTWYFYPGFHAKVLRSPFRSVAVAVAYRSRSSGYETVTGPVCSILLPRPITHAVQ